MVQHRLRHAAERAAEARASSTQLTVGGVSVAVARKPIRNLYVSVHPPDGEVRVAAPRALSDAEVRAAVTRKLAWIARKRAMIRARVSTSPDRLVSGESHDFLGRSYHLDVVETRGKAGVVLREPAVMELRVRAPHDAAARARVLDRWYREQLAELVPPLVEKWEPRLGVRLSSFGIKRMRTRWGTCNTRARRMWVNLELAKKPVACLDYLVLHELAHLIVRAHDARFYALMDEHLPGWKAIRSAMNAAPIGA